MKAFDLAPGESRQVLGMWTSEKPTLPNLGLCIAMIGTEDNNLVNLEVYKFAAAEFEAMPFRTICNAEGKDLNLIYKISTPLTRGSYVEAETEWIPPQVERMLVREYFPLAEEIETLSDHADEICRKLMP